MRDSELHCEGRIRADLALKQLQAASEAGAAPDQLWYLYVLEVWLRRERAAATEPVLAGDTRSAV